MSLSSILSKKAEESKAAAVIEPGQTPPDNDTDTDSVIEEEEEFFIPAGAYHSTRIKRLIRANGRIFSPDENGYYVTDDPELVAQLDYFVEKGLVSKGPPVEASK